MDARASREFRRAVRTPPKRLAVLRELKLMNLRKVGAPFRHPDCVIRWAMRVRAAGRMSYRDTVGDICHQLEALGLPPLSHSQLYERAHAVFEATVHTTDVCDGRVLAYGAFPAVGREGITAAVDATGFSLNKYGGWKFHKWDLEPVTGWVKLHALIDVETLRILSFVVTDEGCGDPTCFQRLLELALQAGHGVTRLLADAAYDNLDHWRLCSELDVEFVTNIKSPLLGKYLWDRRVRSNGLPVRAAHIRRIREVGRAQWKEEVGYSVRWRIEGMFSDLKRRFGDIMDARDRRRMAADIYWRMDVHNLYKGIRSTLA